MIKIVLKSPYSSEISYISLKLGNICSFYKNKPNTVLNLAETDIRLAETNLNFHGNLLEEHVVGNTIQ